MRQVNDLVFKIKNEKYWLEPPGHHRAVWKSCQSGALSLVQIVHYTDTVLSLVEPYYAGAKVYVLLWHDKWLP